LKRLSIFNKEENCNYSRIIIRQIGTPFGRGYIIENI